jgi:hypothetical protein
MFRHYFFILQPVVLLVSFCINQLCPFGAQPFFSFPHSRQKGEKDKAVLHDRKVTD